MVFFFSLAALAVATQAALLPIAKPTAMQSALHQRQVAASDTTTSASNTPRTLGFRSVATNAEGYIAWTTSIYYEWEDNTVTNNLHFTTTGDFYDLCVLPSVTSQSYYWPDSASSCTIWTTCSLGILYAANSASVTCVDGVSGCHTDYLYDSWGATDGLTSLDCSPTYSTSPTASSYYIKQPPLTVPAPATNLASTTSESAATGSSSLSPSNTSVESSTPAPPPKPSNTKIIAGAAVGGIVGLAFAAVAALLILKHYRYRAKPQTAGTFTQAAYYEDKSHGQGDVPEWVPSPPDTSPTPNQMIRNDGYHPDSIRNGTSGARSPTH